MLTSGIHIRVLNNSNERVDSVIMEVWTLVNLPECDVDFVHL